MRLHMSTARHYIRSERDTIDFLNYNGAETYRVNVTFVSVIEVGIQVLLRVE